MNEFALTLAGVPLVIAPRFENTWKCFPGAERLCRSSGDGAVSGGPPPISIPDAHWALFRSRGFADTAEMEFSLLAEYCSDALLPRGLAVIHSVALRWRDRAWLICAPSGTGKSTQAGWLRTLRPGEFGVISGDRPILQLRHSERSEESASPVSDCHPDRRAAESKEPSSSILVHPSPWNGKERWYGAEAAPLAGVILLERGERNRLYALSEQEAAAPFYGNVIQTGWDPGPIRLACACVTQVLHAVPIWKLVTHQPPDSTKLLLESVFV